MRIWIGVLGLMLVLASVAMLARNQVPSALHAAKPAPLDASTPTQPPAEGVARRPGSDPAQRAAHYKQGLDAALQTVRPIEDDAK